MAHLIRRGINQRGNPQKYMGGVKNQKKEGMCEDIKATIHSSFIECFSRGTNREMFCDFTVVVEDYEFPCHRFVLNACSGFFEALLRSDMKERREMKATVHGISPDIFRLVLGMIYGNFDVLTPDNMTDIWRAAHQLQITFLISACEELVLRNITSENCYLIYSNAQFLQSPQVTNSVLNFMVKKFFSVVKSENFMKLEYEDLLQILKNEQLPVCVDFQIEAILKWCETTRKDTTRSDRKSSSPAQDHHRSSQIITDHHRSSYLGNLIKAVNLNKASKQCLASLLTNTFVQEDKTAVAAVNSQAANSLFQPHNNGGYYGYGYPNKFGNNYYQEEYDEKTQCCQHCGQEQHLADEEEEDWQTQLM